MDDLKPLLVFAAVLEHGSMNAAAQALAMTPSAVSQHIARLENLHGVKLLHRSTRRVSPTDAGAALGQYCRRLNATLHDTRLALANLKTEIAGEVRLAAPTSMANAAAFQRALRRIGDEHPALRLQLHFGEALADLRSGAIDIALRGGNHALDAPDLVARPLADWRWQICAAPAWLEHAPPIHTPGDLTRQRWLHHLPLHLEIQRGEARYLLDIEDSLYCNQLAAVRVLCETGLGLALMLEGEAAAALACGRLQRVLPEWTLPAVSIYAVVAGRLLFGDVSTPALQARFAGGGEQFVFVQDAQGDVVDGVEVGGVAVRLKSRFGGGNRGKIAADLVQHQRLSAHDDDDQQQADGAAVAVCHLVQQRGEDDKSADERGAGFERRGFGRIRRLLCHCRAPCCG